MKKVIVLVAIIAFALSIVLVSGNAVMAASKNKKAEEKKPTLAAVAPTVAAPAEAPAEKVVCKFKDKEQMEEFEKLYMAKQATFSRMSVLQAYFSLEQKNLQEIDKQSDEKFKFKMDPSKMYDLNRDTMEIREIGDIPKQPAQAPAQQ